MTLQNWVKLPTLWISQSNGLRRLRWTKNEGADNLAALMLLTVIAHHADPEVGVASLTYTTLSEIAGLSRAKVSGGLSTLEKIGCIARDQNGRSTFKLSDFDPTRNWGKLPARRLYSHDRIPFYTTMSLRRPSELHALKLYLLFVALRDDDLNMAMVSYDRIEAYSGIERHNIKPGLSLLAANGVVHVEHVPSRTSEYGIANGYRLAFIDDRRHAGTTLRKHNNEFKNSFPVLPPGFQSPLG